MMIFVRPMCILFDSNAVFILRMYISIVCEMVWTLNECSQFDDNHFLLKHFMKIKVLSCPLRLQCEVLQCWLLQYYVTCEISMPFGLEKHNNLLVVSIVRKICVDTQDGLQMWSSLFRP